MTARKPVVYLAHPKGTYGSPFAKAQLAALVRQLPGWQVIDPEAHGWTSDREWLDAWPGILGKLDALAVYGEHGTWTVGAGCFTEWHDATLNRLPLLGLDDDGALCELVALAPLSVEVRSMRRCARVMLGRRLSALDVAGIVREAVAA